MRNSYTKATTTWKTMKHLNKDLQPLAKGGFPNRGPWLFVRIFSTNAKSMSDSIRALKSHLFQERWSYKETQVHRPEPPGPPNVGVPLNQFVTRSSPAPSRQTSAQPTATNRSNQGRPTTAQLGLTTVVRQSPRCPWPLLLQLVPHPYLGPVSDKVTDSTVSPSTSAVPTPTQVTKDNWILGNRHSDTQAYRPVTTCHQSHMEEEISKLKAKGAIVPVSNSDQTGRREQHTSKMEGSEGLDAEVGLESTSKTPTSLSPYTKTTNNFYSPGGRTRTTSSHASPLASAQHRVFTKPLKQLIFGRRVHKASSTSTTCSSWIRRTI